MGLYDRLELSVEIGEQANVERGHDLDAAEMCLVEPGPDQDIGLLAVEVHGLDGAGHDPALAVCLDAEQPLASLGRKRADAGEVPGLEQHLAIGPVNRDQVVADGTQHGEFALGGALHLLVVGRLLQPAADDARDALRLLLRFGDIKREETGSLAEPLLDIVLEGVRNQLGGDISRA
ncbi:hypothetical protein [Bosea sp. AS-1]|uniref:hypothetical protein n=1 Tax=Bosea sp. AS-1 TaxID=2015316 RepID=UPI000B77C759|nr:hypothetical protein [Bosea sp. AS-1]